MESQLSTTHQKTYQHIFQHPMPHNLQWREVWSMLSAMTDANAAEDADGKLKVTRNGQTLVLHRPRGKDLADNEELMQLRHFLERSGTPAPTPAKTGTHLLVVIDHREARIFNTELHGSVPQRIAPYDPFGFGRDPPLQPGRFQRPTKTRTKKLLRSHRQNPPRRHPNPPLRHRHRLRQRHGTTTRRPKEKSPRNRRPRHPLDRRR